MYDFGKMEGENSWHSGRKCTGEMAEFVAPGPVIPREKPRMSRQTDGKSMLQNRFIFQ